jgi:hypothetical protein
MQAGALGLSSDLDYFKALGNSLIGDEKAMARNLESARIGQQFASGALGNLEQFSEFIDEPTFGGFISQVAKGTGQLVPFAVTSVLGAGFGAGAALATRGVAEGSKFAAKKIVRESLENVAKDTATPDQKEIADAAFSLAKDARRGAITGAFGAEFAPLSGQNFSEGIESGQDPNDPLTALRALAVGAPQAAIGVGGEIALLKLVGNRAKKLSAGNEGTVMGRLAKDLGTGFVRGGATEATTETVQEGLAVLNRAQMDESFTAQEGKMRLGEAAFAAFFGGGAFAGAGSVAAGGVREVNNIPDGVRDRARGMFEQGKEATVNFVSNAQAQMGMGGMTNPESSTDLDAQVRAIYDDSSTKTAVWIESDTPAYGATRRGGVKKVTIDGQEGYVAFVPGKGTIVAKTFDVAQEVVKGGATPAILAVALGYSAEKPSTSDRVVQVTNSDGAVISEQATDEEGLPAALVAGQGLKPDGGNVEIKSPEDVLAERQAKVNAEAGPVVRNISVAPDGTISRSDRDVEAAAAQARQDLADEDTEDFKAIGQRLRALARAPENKDNERLQQLNRDFRQGDIDRKREIVAALRAEQDLLAQADTTTPDSEFEDTVADPTSAVNEQSAVLIQERDFAAVDEVFEGTEAARQAFDEEFAGVFDTDWSSPFWGRMSESMLKNMVSFRQRGLEVQITPPERRADDRYGLQLYSTEAEQFRHTPRKGPERLLELAEFLAAEIKMAVASQFAKGSGFKITAPDGEPQPVNLVDLANAGRRLLATRNQQNFQAGSDGDALIEMLNELIVNGYSITVEAQGRDAQGRTVKRDVDITARNERGSTILDELARYQQSVGSWFLANSTPVEGDTTQRELNDGAPEKPQPPEFLKPILKTRVGRNKQDTLGKALAKNLTRTAVARDIVEQEQATEARRQSELEERASRQQGVARPEEVTERPLEEEQAADVEAFEQAVERQEAAEAGLDDRPDFIGDESVDNPNPFQRDEDPPYAYYSVASPSGSNRIYGNPISFPFGEPIAVIAKPIMRAASKLRLKLPIGLVTISQLQGLTQGQIAERFGDRTVAGAFIKAAADLRDSPDVLGRYVGFKNAHFIIIDDTQVTNDYEATLIAAHELGHAVFQEEFTGLIGKPVFSRMWESFKNRDRGLKAYSGPHGFEEWFADNVAKWVDIQTRKDVNQRPANMEESVFKRVARRLIDMFNTMRVELRRRYGGDIDVSVNDFIESVIRSNTNNNISLAQDAATVATFEKRAMVRSIEVEIEKTKGAEALSEKLKDFALGSLKDLRKSARPLLKVLRTANKELRSISQPIAEMFYVEAQASGRGSRMGMLQEADVQNREFETKFERDVGFKIDSDEVAVAMDEAQSEVATDQLQNETAKKIRKFLQDIYTEYVEPRQAGYPDSQKIGFQENFFPVVLDMQAIANRTEAFKQLILNAPGQVGRQELPSDRRITRALNRLLKYQDVVKNQDLPVDQDLDPAAGREEERQLTADIPREVLAEAGFLIPPVEAFKLYQRQLVRRIEWNKATKNERGQDILTPLMNKLSEEDRKYAREIINSYLGYGYEPMSERRRRIQSFLLASQYTILLPLAAIGSLPELAGPIINSKEFNGFEMAFRQIKDRVSLAEAKELAEDIGLVQNDAIANGWISVSEREFMDTAARNWTDGFFKYTGLQWFTNFTRTFATGMGVQFLLRHAKNETNNPRSERYLRDLGVTAQEILAWENSGRDITTPEGRAVKFALQKFVESSILRPNAAERPSWASDPRWALVWQLKSYFYAFYTKIIGGIKREASTRLEEGEGGARIAGATAMLALSAVALLPLAMAGLELREYTKTVGAFVLTFGQSDKNYFRSDSMEWGSYLNEVVDRAGIYGPLSIWSMAYKTGQWNGPTAGLATLFGPTAESVEAALRGDVDRLLPVAAVL